MKEPNRKHDLGFLAILVGPVLIASGLVLGAIGLQRTAAEVRQEIFRNCDYLKTSHEFLETHLLAQDGKTDQILGLQRELRKQQEELWAALQEKKLGLLSVEHKSKTLAGIGENFAATQ